MGCRLQGPEGRDGPGYRDSYTIHRRYKYSLNSCEVFEIVTPTTAQTSTVEPEISSYLKLHLGMPIISVAYTLRAAVNTT
jgi:hypothetical protein